MTMVVRFPGGGRPFGHGRPSGFPRGDAAAGAEVLDHAAPAGDDYRDEVSRPDTAAASERGHGRMRCYGGARKGSHATASRLTRSPVPVVWLTLGLGLLTQGIAVTVSRSNYGVGLGFFWIAILAPFASFSWVLLRSPLSSIFRQFVVCLIGVYPSICYRMSSPLVLGSYDEHLHERTLQDLLAGSGLFAPNPLLTVSPYYPGMELFSGAAVRLTGAPVQLVMVAVPLLCRGLLVLVLYRMALTINSSPRFASLVVLFYAVSPQFYLFDSQFAYETMALTLGFGGIYLLRRAQLETDQIAARIIAVLATIALMATVITHHITSWIVLAFLLAWITVSPRGRRKRLVLPANAMALAVAAWTTLMASKLSDYLGPVFSPLLQQSEAFFSGGGDHQLFSDPAGTPSPLWERGALLLYACMCTTAALLCGWLCLRRAVQRRNGPLALLGLACLAYPATLMSHLIPAAGEIGDRASTFLFFPLATATALLVVGDARLVSGGPRYFGPRFVACLAGFATLTYLGGVLLGSGPDWERLPGPYMVSAENRTQDARTLAAVRWAASHLPPGSRIVADRIPADLLAAEARLWPVSAPLKGLEPAWLYFPDTWGPGQTAIVRGLKIDYIYVDLRLADSLPHVGYYFYDGESAFPWRIAKVALEKFQSVSGLRVVYRNGPISIYDTAGLGGTREFSGFIGDVPQDGGPIIDTLAGVMAAVLLLIGRRRCRRICQHAAVAGMPGACVVVMAFGVFAGALLFGTRLMPGSMSTVGATITITVYYVVARLRAHDRRPIRVPLMRPPSLSVALGLLAGIGGIALAIVSALSALGLGSTGGLDRNAMGFRCLTGCG
jgi:hypothetical protein